MLFVLVIILAVLVAISFVFAVILAVFALILLVFVVTLVFNEVILEVLLAILFVFEVIFEVLVAMSFVFAVILAVFEAIKVGNVEMVEELTPPTLFTTGASAVPPKSFDNCNFPFTVALASATEAFVTNEATNAVVAI